MHVWKIGLKAPADEKGLVRREAVGHCIWEIMEGERGKEIKKKCLQMEEVGQRGC